MAAKVVPLSNDLLELLVNAGYSTVSSRQSYESESEEDLSSRRANSTLLSDAISRLTPMEQEVIWLRFWEGMTYRHIQNHLGHKSVSQTYRLVQSVLGKMREVLQNEVDR